ncbi:hypothetical protein DL96DRAFT_1628562 [Flagelloscypha sp. PMI_526]|nr:hypothetical protein DL96DRAFT_1628562 [Flagelloscypha sp. PMI_526]
MSILDEDRLAAVLPALHNPDVAKRLHWLIFNPTLTDRATSNVRECLEILNSSSIHRLDLVVPNWSGHPPVGWTEPGLAVRFTQIPHLHYLKLDLSFFSNPEMFTVLQATALRDLDLSSTRLDGSRQWTSGTILGSNRPVLDTLRIRYGAEHWRQLFGYFDLCHMKRLAVWDYDHQIGDLENDWGGLIEVSASTLQSLSLWLTPNIIDQDIPQYLRSALPFPALCTLSLFAEVKYFGGPLPPTQWSALFAPIIAAFCACSPSLRHIRLYVHTWEDEFPYEALLEEKLVADFARDMIQCQNLETIELSFRSASRTFRLRSNPNPFNAKAVELKFASTFSPVRLTIGCGVRYNHAWPFFEDDA